MNFIKSIKELDLNVLIIVGLYVVFLYCQVTQGQFIRQIGTDSIEFSYGVSALSSFSMYSASLLAIGTGVIRVIKSKVRYDGYIPVLFVFSSFLCLWLVVDVSSNGLASVLKHSSCNPTIYFILWAMFIAFSESSWNTIVKLARIIGPVLLVWSLIQSLSFQSLFGGYIGNSPQILLLGNGICTVFVAMLGHKHKDSLLTVSIFVSSIFCGIVTAVIYANRSWIVQCILLLFFYFYKQSKGESLPKLSTIIITGAVLYFMYCLMVDNFADSFDYLMSRGLSDTRSWQYQEIFNQYTFSDLFLGKGTFGTYKSAQYGDYGYIDNTTMLIWFHFGFITACCLVYLLLKAPIHILISKQTKKCMKTTAIICMLWFLALNGLSVYNTIIWDLRNVMMVFAIGRCVKMCHDIQYCCLSSYE